MKSAKRLDSIPSEAFDEFSLEPPLSPGRIVSVKEKHSQMEETDWRAVKIAGAVFFLSMLENTVVGMGEWPYMHQIDPNATAGFFGTASAISKVGKITCALVFSYWTYRTKTVRPPLIAGRLIAFVGCILYLCVEFVPSGRRYLMMCCYLLFGIASSSSVVLRAYLVAVSTASDRSRAFAAVALAATLSIVAGPVTQLAFSGIKYPGLTILPHIHFHLYSAPIWIATFVNFISVAVVLMCLEEKLLYIKNEKEDDDEAGFTVEGLKKKLAVLRKADIAWGLVLLCCMEKIVTGITPSTLMTVGSPLKMAVFGWDGQKTVRITSITMAISGTLAILVAAIFMGSRFTKLVPARISFLFAITISIFFYIGTSPLPGISQPLPAYNATTGDGCNPASYNWCTTAEGPHPLIYIMVSVCVLGIAMPIVHISLDTVYSKVLANIDQSLMQGIIVAFEDIIMIAGPVYSSNVFTRFGQTPLWIANGVVTLIGALAWLLHLRKLKWYN